MEVQIIGKTEADVQEALNDMVEQGWTSEGITQEGSDYVATMNKEE